MKKSQVVQDAERLVEEKRAAVDAAQKALDAAMAEHYGARQALVEVHRAEDDKLPRCKMLTIGWRSGKPRDEGQDMVILRKTPTGVLVTRRHGEPGGHEFKFKWSAHSARFIQAEKSLSVTSDTRQLQDVPQEFLPAGAVMAEDLDD